MHKMQNECRRKFARILAVDDEPIYLAMVKTMLESASYEVQTAGNGFEALATLKRSLPDLVVSDLRMPEMSGFELLTILRRRFPQIPTIAVSGEISADALSGSLADMFLEKGCYSPAQLLASIRDLLDRSPLRPPLPQLEKTPVCLPLTSTGKHWLMCNECLRGFLFLSEDSGAGKPKWTWCPFCKAELAYFVDPIFAGRVSNVA